MSDNDLILKQLRENNPFESSASPVPWENMNPDLQQLNRSASEEIEQLIRHKRREPSMPLAGLILGESGSGKTHMLTRILRRLRTNSRPAIFVTVRAFRDPESVTQDLLSEIFISLLQIHSSNKSQFDMLVNEVLSSYRERRINDGFASIDKIDMRIYLARDMPGLDKNVLKCILLYAGTTDENMRALIIDWLREGLDEEDSLKLGLPSRDINSMTDAKKESAAEKILISLGLLLAYAHVPMIVCFDQLDSMNGNQELIFAFGNIIHLLSDNLVGILPLCFMKPDIWNVKIKPCLNSSVYQRLEHHKITMGECSISQAQQLIRERIAFAFCDKDSETQEKFYQFLIDRVKLKNGFSPRMVIELANRAIFRDEAPNQDSTQTQTQNQTQTQSQTQESQQDTQILLDLPGNNKYEKEIFMTLKGVFNDECNKIKRDVKSWPPNADLLALSLRVWLSSHENFKVSRGSSKHLKVFAEFNNKKFAFFIVTGNNNLSHSNALKQGINFLNEYICYYISEAQLHKSTWKQVAKLLQEFQDAGGKVLLINKFTRVEWYGLAALINRVDNGDVNIYPSTGARAATRDDIKIFVRSLNLLNINLPKSQSQTQTPEKTESQVPASFESVLIEIVNASPMKLISINKSLEFLAARDHVISRPEFMNFLQSNNKFRLFNSRDDILITMADRK
ncbi:MAG: hypothetical protein IJS99_03585 [Synergistaceae bacterium]|nr:hypothetical protein [Synergistaceae bacterium]